jgi:hypothetical protein
MTRLFRLSDPRALLDANAGSIDISLNARAESLPIKCGCSRTRHGLDVLKSARFTLSGSKFRIADLAATAVAQRQRRMCLCQELFRQFLVVDHASEHHRTDHGRPGGNRRAPFCVRRVTLCVGTEMTEFGDGRPPSCCVGVPLSLARLPFPDLKTDRR